MSTFLSFFHRLNRNRLTTVGLFIFFWIIILILITPLLPLADPDETNLARRLLPPLHPDFWLGTDQLGRDILSRLLWGTRVSLAVGFIATAFAALIGSAIGLLSGYFRGRIDFILMRGIDSLMAFPYILLALAIVAAFGPGLLNALFAIAIVNIPFFARTVRGVAVTLSHKEFIQAARCGGGGHLEVLIRELLPNVLPVIVVTISTTSGWMILETAGLSFLGLGAQPPTADLGSMLGEGRKLLFTAPYVATLPGLVILVVVISLNLIGDGIRDALDPRLQGGALRSPLPRTRVTSTSSPSSQTPNSDAKLSIHQLSINLNTSSGNDSLIRDVNLELQPGECLGIVGESGSGKSVTALSITGLASSPPLSIDSGNVWMGEHNLITLPLSQLQDLRGAKIAYVFQDPLTTLNPVLTVGRQLKNTLHRHQSLSSQQAYSRSLELLQLVHIANPEERLNAYPHQLSGGMRQRVVIALALAHHPEVLIADEPTTALDVTIQAEILALFNELREKLSLSIIFITHDLGVVASICDRVAVMYAGQIVELGTTFSLLRDPQHPYTQELLKCTPEIGTGEEITGGIPGIPPLPGQFPLGCGFAPRCPFVQDSCNQTMPELKVHQGRQVRCVLPFLADKVAL